MEAEVELTMDGAAGAVVNFLLRERYLLSALEFLHELIENGLAESEPAVRLQRHFADPDVFPPDQLLRFQLQDTGTQQLLDEKASAVEKAAVLEYELRLAQEDIKALQEKLAEPSVKERTPHAEPSRTKGTSSGTYEKKDLNCAVKEYLVSAGYKLTAMTFCEEVVDQDLDDWGPGPGRAPNALQEYYRAFLSNERKQSEGTDMVQNDTVLLELKESFETERSWMKKALEGAQTAASYNEALVRELKEALKQTSLELDAAKAEIMSLRLQQENSKQYQPMDGLGLDKEKVISTVEIVVDGHEQGISATDVTSELSDSHKESPEASDSHREAAGTSTSRNSITEHEFIPQDVEHEGVKSFNGEEEPQTVSILADALPKIVPYVLINHREELLPLIICAIGRHPDSNVRDSLTHTLFNLIKRPDQEQRRIIMDACISLSTSIGDIRTETELLPQCWEQIDDKYEERRLLVAQSCGELGQFVRPEMRSSLILSILEQLIEDPAAIVREAASHNLALLLPLFHNMDKYTKVEKMMFQLVCDPSGQVVETTLRELVPAVVSWGSSVQQVLKRLLLTLLNHMLSSAQRCPPMSGVETSSESQLRSLGERERWNIEVLLRMLTQLLPDLQHACLASCPFERASESDSALFFSEDLLKLYLQGNTKWEDFDWLALECFPSLLKLAAMLPPREESLRKCICKLLFIFNDCFGEHYHTMVILPIFLTAIGDDSQISHFGFKLSSKIRSLKPQTVTAETLALKCILPLLLAGVVGVPNRQEGAAFSNFLKELILQSSLRHGLWSRVHAPELVEAVRFLCSFGHHHGVVTSVLWELVVNPNASVKVNAALLFKELVPYANTKLVTQQLVPALVTLGSDTNLEVRYTSISAFGTVAQHFRDDAVTEKIRVQMDAFLDDGSNEAVIGVVRALTVAVPLAAPALRDYLLQKLVLLTANSMGTNLKRRREKADVFCEAIRSLDGTDLSPASVRELLLPAIQNLMRDPEALDPAHKEALEVILRERSGGTFDAISKVVGAHLNMSSMSMTSIFGEATTPGKNDVPTTSSQPSSPQQQQQQQPPQQEEGVLKRMMMRANFGGVIRGRGS